MGTRFTVVALPPGGGDRAAFSVRTVYMIRTNEPAKGKGVWVDPPADILEQARTGTLLGVAVDIVEILEEDDAVLDEDVPR